MDSQQITEYRGFQIRVTAIPPSGDHMTFRATYQVQRVGAGNLTRVTGTVAGAFLTPEKAIEAATIAAQRSVDERLGR